MKTTPHLSGPRLMCPRDVDHQGDQGVFPSIATLLIHLTQCSDALQARGCS